LPSIQTKLSNTFWLALAYRREKKLSRRSTDELVALQNQRLQGLIEIAWQEVPFYARLLQNSGLKVKDIRSAEDLARLPLLDKLDLTRFPGKYEAPPYAGGDGLTLRSSGTSGLHRTLRHETRSILSALAAGRRHRLAMMGFVGREFGYREAILNRPGHAGQQIRMFIESRTVTAKRLDLQRIYISPSTPFVKIAEHLNAFRPDVIRGIGSHLGAFYRWVYESKATCHIPKAIAFGADAMLASDREILEQKLGVPVFGTYQAVEALRIGYECEARQGYHLYLDQCVVRVVDSAGLDVGPGGRGEAVITNLMNRATPVINYRLGDVVTQAVGDCPCGLSTPRLMSIDGRLDDLIIRPDGTRMPALVLIPSLQAMAGVRQVKIIQVEMNRFVLQVVSSQGASFHHASLIDVFRKVLGAAVMVEIETVEGLKPEASGKTKSFVSMVNSEW
jgi:phenylacetate-CoA ligase